MARSELQHVESVGLPDGKAQEERLTLAEVIERNRPNPWGFGYKRLYLMCALVLLCSTMNGKHLSIICCG
jgi:hypothetical protein